jgi:transcription-repair coupling factor (superfamily II helicase)
MSEVIAKEKKAPAKKSKKVSEPTVQKAAEKALDETQQEVKSERAKLYETLAQPEVEENLYRSAKNLNDRFRGNSFTIQQVMKKTNVKLGYEAMNLLNMLELKGYASRTEIGRDVKFKITLPVVKQVETLKKQKADLQEQLDLIDAQMQKLEALL